MAYGGRGDGRGRQRAVEALIAPGAPFAVVRGEDGELRYADGPRTLREVVEVTWAFGDHPFLIGESASYTYREFFAAACALARRFADEYGLRPGDRAAIAMRNHPEWQIAFWAAQLAGLVAVPLNAWWTEEELTYALDDCTPRLLLVDGERLPRVSGWSRRARARVIVFQEEREGDLHGDRDGGREGDRDGDRGGDLHGRLQRYEDFDAPDPLGAPPAVDVRPEDDATVIYTSGTTGRPKGAVATHHAQAGAALHPRFHAAVAALARGGVPGQGSAPVALMTFPFFHVAAFTTLYSMMGVGGTLVLMRKWDAERALALIAEHRVTHYAGVPTTALQLLDAAERHGDGLATLVNLGTGGAPAPARLVRRLTARYGRRIEPRNGYGLTETSGGVLVNSGEEYRRDPAAAGRPAPAVEVRIADGDGRPLPEGETGELWLRGQSLVRGYWRDERATAEAFRDGWFRTGDLAVVRDGGCVTIVDRIKDMILRGGENVYCAEVESVLQTHPDVADAAVLGVPHPLLGEEVAAVVQLRDGVDQLGDGADQLGDGADQPRDGAVRPQDGADQPRDGADATAERLREHAAKSLAAFKVPSRLILGEVPRNPTGKILKRELRDRFTSE
ncbi:class I adenylate-forming enzyme family protein [Streptomyces jumonjinensis]|uniref:class I adenylate-forming enzyme family protein n=1 Tax=Streptomyces jumonjinensis TaxID=1945 RepID=UPI00379B5410